MKRQRSGIPRSGQSEGHGVVSTFTSSSLNDRGSIRRNLILNKTLLPLLLRSLRLSRETGGIRRSFVLYLKGNTSIKKERGDGPLTFNRDSTQTCLLEMILLGVEGNQRESINGRVLKGGDPEV